MVDIGDMVCWRGGEGEVSCGIVRYFSSDGVWAFVAVEAGVRGVFRRVRCRSLTLLEVEVEAVAA